MMDRDTEKAKEYLRMFCVEIKERVTGSEGNIRAAELFSSLIKACGFKVKSQGFKCMKWEEEGARLAIGGKSYKVLPGPYSLPCDIKAPLCSASSITELAKLKAKKKILFLHGDIVKEQLMPKSFVFYNPPEHKEIHRLLDASGALAVIAATGKNPALAGGMYPFPFIEDGDCDIPNAFMKDTEGKNLADIAGSEALLQIASRRIPSKGCNVIAGKKGKGLKKIIICAHIDSKPGTPGAIDNASGIVILLLLAELLKGYKGQDNIEIVALNGEDYYSIPGQMKYLEYIKGGEKDIKLVINMDGAGYKKEMSAYSYYNCAPGLEKSVKAAFEKYKGIKRGADWIQSDHGMFVYMGIPAVAVTSNNFMEKLSVEITHTAKDKPSIVDCRKLVEISYALNDLIGSL